MDKLTAIKIKYDDNTYSDEIPVSALAKNVEWDNTHTLVDILGSIDVTVTGTIQDQISQLFNEKISITQLNNYVASQLNTDVTNWLNNNVDPVGSAVIVDSSLTIQGAAAGAKVVGNLKSIINDNTSDISALQASVTNLGTHKVAQPLDGNNRPTNGTSGQSLRTKGDGATEWADVGLPTDAQTAQAVSDWLDAHPEATTTVQDGSLTEAKFSNALKLKAIKEYVTPEMFGAVGDGVTDDTDAVIEALTHKNVVGIGTYAISSAIYAQIDSDASIAINLKAIKSMDYMLWLDAKDSAWNNLVEGDFSIKLDCNLLADEGLRIDRFHGAKVDAIVKNFTGNAVTVRYTDRQACGANHINVFATNLETADTVSENATALKSGQDDIYNVSCANVKTAVKLAYGGNQFINLHAWSTTEEWFTKSVMIEINTDSDNSIDFLSCDTIQVLFKMDNSGSTRYPKLNVRRLDIYNNTRVTKLPIYIWWLATTKVFIPVITGIYIDRVGFKNAISWSHGTVPNILVGDSATETDISANGEISIRCSVITFKKMVVTELDYILNCEDCSYSMNGIECNLDVKQTSNSIEQKLDSYRASARRSKPINMIAWSFPWVDNSFNQRTFNRQITFVSGTTTYELVDISLINGLIGTAIATVMGTFANVTSQPKIFSVGSKVYVVVDTAWLAENAGKKTFFGMVLTNGAIS